MNRTRQHLASKGTPKKPVKDKIHQVMLELVDRLPDEMDVEIWDYHGVLFSEEKKTAIILNAYPSSFSLYVRTCARVNMWSAAGYRVLTYFYSNVRYHMDEYVEQYVKMRGSNESS